VSTHVAVGRLEASAANPRETRTWTHHWVLTCARAAAEAASISMTAMTIEDTLQLWGLCHH